MNQNLFQKVLDRVVFNAVVYKSCCIAAFMLVPSIFFCFFPQVVSVVFLLWGAAILLHDLFEHRSFLKSPGSMILCFFVLSYVITLIFFSKNELLSTFNVFFWMIIEFFLLFAIDHAEKKTFSMLLYDMSKINVTITVVALVSAILSMVCFFLKLAVVMPDPEGLNQFWSIGIVNGRNSGIFNNPIPLASAMFLGCVSSAYNFFFKDIKKKRQKTYYIIVFCISFMCIQTTLTRTYVYGLYMFVAIAAFAGLIQFFRKKQKAVKRFFASLGAALVVTGLVAGVGQIMKLGMVKIVSIKEPISILINVDQFGDQYDGKTYEEIQAEINKSLALDSEVTLSRDEIKRLPSFFYPRNELWKVALQVIPHSPLFGFTSGNLASTSLQYGDTEYFNSNWETGIPTYHNAYFDIAVSAGLIGLVLMLLFLAFHIYRTVRVLLARDLPDQTVKSMFSYGVLAAFLATHVFCICLFFGTIVFNNLAICLYFWTVLGFVARINDITLQKDETLSANKVFSNLKGLLHRNHE